MRKMLTLILAMISFIAHAQLKFTPNGFQGQDGKEYIVLEHEGLTQDELYKKSLTYLQGIFNMPNHALSTVEGQSITVNGFEKSAIKNRYRKLRYTYDLRYSATFEFKDGKIKFQVNDWKAGPLVNIGDFKPFRDYYGVYNEALELQNQAAKDVLDYFFNSFVTIYQKEVLSKEDW